VNVVFALVPKVVIALRHTITIRANITAYSTAVGPSSDLMNCRNFKARFFISFLRKRRFPTEKGANAAGVIGKFVLQSRLQAGDFVGLQGDRD
jgi:hypothetical protein